MIKIKKGFILRSVAGRTVVVPDGEMLDLNLMIGLNDTGCFLWKCLEKGIETADELKRQLMDEYRVEEDVAAKDVERFIENCKKNGFLE